MVHFRRTYFLLAVYVTVIYLLNHYNMHATGTDVNLSPRDIYISEHYMNTALCVDS